jgi:hypothetical protein
MKLGLATEEVERAEIALAEQLVTLAQRHQFESDVYHMGMARAMVCAEHLAQLGPLLTEFDAPVVEDAYRPDFVDNLSRHTAPPGERTAPTALALLHDLRETYAAAHRAEISWIMLQQAAKAARQPDLLDVTTTGVEQTEQTWKWLRTKIKDAAPQAFAT